VAQENNKSDKETPEQEAQRILTTITKNLKKLEKSLQKHLLKRKLLLGLGLDSDGEARLTRGDNFFLVGGTEETHEKMQEKAVRFNEDLARRGKTLDQLSTEEFYEIADKIGLNVIDKVLVIFKILVYFYLFSANHFERIVFFFTGNHYFV